ncbi:lipopolysaccharide biosynthesis protein [Microbacterium sp. CCNWLW134]|uniref:lipopolysaccharide biosynthesis protein n=1 Tax=Microbacterium sp. CCNWLW134 TaxID=3122064 RepID=UPI00300FEA6B
MITGAGQLLRVTVQLVSLVVLARLLQPSDFGLVAMTTAVVGVGEVFRDFGLSSAAIQAKSISEAQRSNLFWINTGIGIGLALIAIAFGPLVALFYGEPAVVALMAACSTTFIANGLATQHRADLNRRLRFGALTLVDTCSQILSVVAAIAVAVAGGGYWALVVLTVGQAFLGLIGVVLAARWVPRWYRRGVRMEQFFRFGAGLAGSQLLGYASKNVDSVVLGATLGPTAVGFYNRAYQVLILPLNQFQAPSTRVALPVLSRLSDDRVRYTAFLLRGQTILLHAVALILALAASQALPLFDMVLGPNWRESVPIFQALAAGGLASMANYACYWVFLSKGLTVSYFWFSLITRPVVIAAIVLGALMGGSIGVALAFSSVSLALWPITLWWLSRCSDAPVVDMFVNGSRAFLVYSLAACLSWASTAFLPSDAVPALVLLLIGTTTFAATLALFALILPSYRNDLHSILDTRRFLRGGGS